MGPMPLRIKIPRYPRQTKNPKTSEAPDHNSKIYEAWRQAPGSQVDPGSTSSMRARSDRRCERRQGRKSTLADRECAWLSPRRGRESTPAPKLRASCLEQQRELLPAVRL